MTTEERDSKLAELNQQSEEIRAVIQANTEAARKLNDENRTLIKQRREVEHAIHALRHVKIDGE